MSGIGLVDGDKLGQFFFKEFIFCFEPADAAEDLFDNLPQGKSSIKLNGFPEFIEVIKLFRFI